MSIPCPASASRIRLHEMKSRVLMCGKQNFLRKPVLRCANFFSISSVILFQLLFLELDACIRCLLSLRHSGWWSPTTVQNSGQEQRRKTLWVQIASCLTLCIHLPLWEGGLFPGYRNEAPIARKQITPMFWFPSAEKVMFTLHCSLLSVQ